MKAGHFKKLCLVRAGTYELINTKPQIIPILIEDTLVQKLFHSLDKNCLKIVKKVI